MSFTKINLIALGATALNVPAFYAYPSGGDQTITSGTFTKVNLNTELYDTDNAFDTSTSRFTVPTGKGGKYFFSSNVIVDNMADGNVVDARLYINGNSISRTYSRSMVSSTGNAVLAPINYVQDLNAGDYVEYYVKHTRGSNRNALAIYTYFAGFKLIGA